MASNSTRIILLSVQKGSGRIQQGMDTVDKTARRYHWHSDNLRSFVEEPHSGVCCINQGPILNLTAREADTTRNGNMQITNEDPDLIIREFQQMILPYHHDVRAEDVNQKTLGAALWLAHDQPPENFEELLLLKGAGPRSLQSLVLVSEVIPAHLRGFKTRPLFLCPWWQRWSSFPRAHKSV